mmetsp:Transcript_9966/g.21582  ORF Transcript_9966/g.21582 Transcript_9966/m.21582 type:complete len:478 (-) Transcript_9966:323-1756(-)|eukprot:CAMPEP_0172539946 /NCGR_PEP_ID=MMETSP1067-20121228/11052_1 /TAXON_ID=265564 ORGANISM="Thalassiosira punctigera, Strain Tpunct2005C2" /NCGR_SAMPLE_ID=MMETSP1067 /ASSEMBLY_ACC=CAM_ASM_000444 /LENGTH=477 /DNA_ID=CAMNT_0013325713 /DNA_START=222 /DNA_END=1655 /DNA_ORIENTATION=+
MKRRSQFLGPPTLSNDGTPLHQTDDIDVASKPKHFWRNRKKNKAMLVAIISSIVLISLKRIAGALFGHEPSSASDASRYGPLNATNEFVARFEDVLLNDLGHGHDIHTMFVPLIFEDGKILCRRKHRRQLSSSSQGFMSTYRTHFFIQMVRKGLSLRNHPPIDIDGGLPILVIEGDGNGCNVFFRRDDYKFPRLAWSMLSSKHGDCEAVGMPSYETWNYFHRSHKVDTHWEQTFEKNERQYPWQSKIKKAVWRGSTTYEGSLYHKNELGDIPRGKLVKLSMEHPDLIDGAFHKINEKFLLQRHELKNQFTIGNRISPREMMRYKAIIDIDGNNWSSRFGMLLCSNSVVIKIDPDFIEYFYDNEGSVQPMIHYIPASLANLTEVVAYVMDEKNEDQMKAMVKSANSWCKRFLSEEGLAEGAILQLERYKSALDSYRNDSWNHDWSHVKRRFTDTIDDMVDCDVWKITDYLSSPMFAGV